MKATFFSTIALLGLTLASTVGASHNADFARRRHHARKTSSSAAISAAEAMNKASDGVPASDFEADASLPAAKLAAAALKLKKVATSYPISDGSKTISKIYTDWDTGKNGSAIVFTADMDVDCDGIDYKCKGNPDGQKETDLGALAAYEVPYIVIPQKYVNTVMSKLPGNNVVAVICDGKMYYGIFGDTNGDTPEVIGEASWRFAQTCFPNGNINGNNGHAPADVTYIVYTGKDAVLPKDALTTNYVTSFATLKKMGDDFTSALAKNIGLSSGESTPASAEPSATKSSKESSSTKSSSTKTASEKKATATGGAGALANGSSGGKSSSCSSD
jgi:chitosanase